MQRVTHSAGLLNGCDSLVDPRLEFGKFVGPFDVRKLRRVSRYLVDGLHDPSSINKDAKSSLPNARHCASQLQNLDWDVRRLRDEQGKEWLAHPWLWHMGMCQTIRGMRRRAFRLICRSSRRRWLLDRE